jgi:hypothetical protein
MKTFLWNLIKGGMFVGVMLLMAWGLLALLGPMLVAKITAGFVVIVLLAAVGSTIE